MVKSLLSLLATRQNSILSGAAILMVTIFASRILGLVRDRLLAHTFSPDQTAIFLASFRIPDLIFQLLIFGAVSVAFIPIFTEELHKKGEDEAFKFASQALNVFLLLYCLVSIIIFLLARPLTNLVVPGFSESQKDLTASLTQIVLLGQILLAIGAFFAALAQSYQRFIIPALAGVFYNLGIILGIIFLTPVFGIYGPTLGVIIGATLHVLIQMPLVGSLGFKHVLSFNPSSQGIKEIMKLMSIRSIGLAVEQINETVGIVLASIISTASVTYLTFANHLYTVPVGLFGATMAQAALPVLSQFQAKGDKESFRTILLTTMHQILFLALPFAAVLIVLRIPVVRLVFGASQFDWQSTVLTGRTVAFFAVGLAAQSIVLLLVRGFYALKDTKTPVVTSILTVALNIVLSVLFVSVLGWEVWSLGLSYAISTNISLVILLVFLSKKIGGFTMESVFLPFSKVLLAAVVSALALYIPIKALDQLVIDTTKTVNLLLLTGIASFFGLSVYLILVWLMQVRELYTFANLIRKIYHKSFNIHSKEILDETTPI